MKRKGKGPTALLLVLTLLATLTAACTGNEGNAPEAGEQTEGPNGANAAEAADNAAPPALDPVELKVKLFGEKPTDMDAVVAEFESRSKEALNTTLDVTFDVAAEYRNKLKLMLAAGEEIDLAFDAPWWDLNANVSKGYYHELDAYFNNDDYPGLKAAFTPEYLEANKIDGHIYAIPVTNTFYDIPVVLIRKDLREKYGMEPVDSYADLKQFLDQVLANENPKAFVPWGGGRNTWYHVFANFDTKQTHYRAFPFEITGTGALFNLVLSEDGKQVLGATTLGDPDEAYSGFPAPLNEPDFFYDHYDTKVEYRKYLPSDPLAQNQTTTVEGGAHETTLNSVASDRQKLKETYPDADYEIFVYNDAVRAMESGAIATGFKAWNFLTVPKSSKNVERTMKFLDWVFASPDHHDLFELGIEGTHWEKDGERYYRVTEQTPDYAFPAYEMTWNPQLSRINGNNDEETLKYIEYEYDQDSYYRMALSGFTFNPENVKNEIAKVQPKFDELRPVLEAGLDPEWRESAGKLNAQMRALGLENIREELIKQAQDYLDSGGQ
ncbi:ABC transporter substrate-binding protein [Paenibacillus sp. IB182496]|uniref:ABC transporter substrate-binding protein n=1 Tax=Paenibacillus sabuli TaxID=2772509 RepID=A0A927GTY7_9BACL|nr:ABC transporter substrate-binding protein [Paenibacillus sabuli]MBD2848118.1 ABC transporter substrate-binding protein [Paenibacillus sabuli]